jgi:hypothetical protein
MAIDYNKLTEDLKWARKCAVIAEANVEDSGTCNLDDLMLELPKASEKKVMTAIEAAGLRGYKTRFMGTPVFLIGPPMPGQAYKRTAQAEAMSRHMSKQGWISSVWYQMD